MPQAGFTPIQTYNSPTAGHIPVNTDLYAGELAINTTDEKLYFKNTGGTVKLLASTAVFTTTGSGSYVLATSPTITGHPTIEGVTSTGATGTGKFVFDSAPTITGHPTIEGVTSTGATGTGKFVFDSAPTITGHPTIEGVTSTGATGTGKFVFDSAPTITGHPTIEGVTSTGATGTGKFVFDSAPTITGHPTIEGVTSTGATGTGKFVFGSSPTLSGVTLSDGTANGVTYLNSSKVLTTGSALTFDGTNLGLNVTPSAWYSGYRAFQISTVASFSGNSDQAHVSCNAYVDTSAVWRRLTSDYVSRYYMYQGNHYWTSAPSGTAGSAISFTQAMTLDSSGNLGLGVTPSAWSFGGNLQFSNNSYITSSGNGIYLSANVYNNGGEKYNSSSYATKYFQTSGQHQWHTAPSGTAGNAISFSQVMTLDASGNLYVGATSGLGANTLRSLYIEGDNTVSGGQVTQNLGQLYASAHDNNGVAGCGVALFRVPRGGGIQTGTEVRFYTGYTYTPSTTNQVGVFDQNGNFIVGATSGSYKITCNGQPGANGYTAWTNYSDERLKENIVDFVSEPVLNKICELRPVSFNYNDKTGFDEETRQRTVSGFIAQEMQQVFPDMVGKTIIGEEEYLDTNLSNLTLYLVKAIQEQQKMIEELKSKIEKL